MQPQIWDELDKDRAREKRSVSSHIEFILERYFELRKLQEGRLDNIFIESANNKRRK
jgi:hypothetical protein